METKNNFEIASANNYLIGKNKVANSLAIINNRISLEKKHLWNTVEIAQMVEHRQQTGRPRVQIQNFSAMLQCAITSEL